MNRSVLPLALGVSTGVTVFAFVVPLVHLLAELATVAGLHLGAWDNPIEIFIFLISAVMVGVFPLGLWIVLTDARRVKMFDEGREVVAYLLAAMAVYVTLTLLVCTRLQPFYTQFRWFITPGLLVCAGALMYWRWSKIWRFPTTLRVRGVLDCALALTRDSGS